MYRGGKHPWQVIEGQPNSPISLATWEGLADTPGSFQDKAKTGAYSYWLPASTIDTEFRDLVNTDEWKHPYIPIAGNVKTNDPTAAGYTSTPIRIRLVMNIEFVSTSQQYTYGPSLLNPAAIMFARKVLHGAPTSMENDSHLTTIYEWLKNAGANVYDWGVRNKGWLLPAAKAAFALGSMMV
jgi:hypothetical protein